MIWRNSSQGVLVIVSVHGHSHTASTRSILGHYARLYILVEVRVFRSSILRGLPVLAVTREDTASIGNILGG